ncbi:hypothetical protein NADFUDRAFT_84251 [Nadsonia fulvescens var. elongata DSM 6958]|uniref:Zn(2)-C6 fungal-type domain-containing protein n=1 Tax=Nadsonia fulvescens var. elongata DSM 6958 TaxID=857566 RepID=A0A1E3PE00_9ASCO|nr:hypothetical protein NADFUDRAFT_84251 [Nadsonia fulvescens var. elongata DSM 6958]
MPSAPSPFAATTARDSQTLTSQPSAAPMTNTSTSLATKASSATTTASTSSSSKNNNPNRVTLACERCRRRHIRCSGGEPCNSCKRTGSACVYVEAEKKIVVSIKYIRNLQAQIAALHEGRDPSTVLTTAQTKKLAKSQQSSPVNSVPTSGVSTPVPSNTTSPHHPPSPAVPSSLDPSRSLSVTSIINLINNEPQSHMSAKPPTSGSTHTSQPSTNLSPMIKSESIIAAPNESKTSTVKSSVPTETATEATDSESITSPNNVPDSKKRKLSVPTGSEVIPGLNNHTKATFSKSDSGQKYYIGSSSMSLFGLELQGLLERHKRRQHTHESNSLLPPRDNKFLEATFSRQNGGVYKLAIGSANSVTEESSAFVVPFTLPTYQDALHYVNTFHLNLSGSFYFFNLGRTLSRIQQTYEFNQKLGPNFENVISSREEAIWYCHMLLIFAVGEMYSTPEKWVPGVPIIPQKPSVPPGAQYFNYASELFYALYQGELLGDCSIRSVEIFLIIGFYLQVCDYPTSYFVYHGICLRTALLLGLHVDADNQQLNPFEREHRRRLFWTVYIFEHYLSAKAGLPLGISDDQIDLPYPQDIDPSNIPPPENAHDTFPPAAFMVSFIEVTKISSEILTSLYRPRRSKESNILPILNDIIVQLFDWRQNLPASLQVDFSQKDLHVDRTICNIYTDYFQCVNLLVRPLLFYFVKKRIERKAIDKNPIDLSGYSKNILTLLNASFKASINCIRSLYSLMPRKQLSIYSYMDREYIFGSAATLILFNTAFGVNQTTAEHINCVLEMLGLMAEVGNFPAKNRRDQLVNLISAFDFNNDSASTAAASTAPVAPTSTSSHPITTPQSSLLPSISGNPRSSSHPQTQIHSHYQPQHMSSLSRPTSPFPHVSSHVASPHAYPLLSNEGRGFGAMSGFQTTLGDSNGPATVGHVSSLHNTLPLYSNQSGNSSREDCSHGPSHSVNHDYTNSIHSSINHAHSGQHSHGNTVGNMNAGADSSLTGPPAHAHQQESVSTPAPATGSVSTPTPTKTTPLTNTTATGEITSTAAKPTIGSPILIAGSTGTSTAPTHTTNTTSATTTSPVHTGTPPLTSLASQSSILPRSVSSTTASTNNNDIYLGLNNSSFFSLDNSNNNLFDPTLEFSPESISLFFGDGSNHSHNNNNGLTDFSQNPHNGPQNHNNTNIPDFMTNLNNNNHNSHNGNNNSTPQEGGNNGSLHPSTATSAFVGDGGYGLMDKERELWNEIANQSAWLSSMGDDFNSLIDSSHYQH